MTAENPYRDTANRGVTRDGELARLTICPASGSLNERELTAIVQRFEQLVADRSVGTICLCGRDDLFLAGADLKFFVRCVMSKNIDRILNFTRAAHTFLERIEQCDKRVVCQIDGPAIGGGVELALAADAIVATAAARFSLPETSLGIYPGMGGTQRLPRRIGAGLAKWLIYTGSVLPPRQAWEIGLADAVQDNHVSAAELSSIGRTARPPLNPKFSALDRFFSNHPVAELLNPDFVQPAEPDLARAVIQVRNKAPLALKTAERLIDNGLRLPLPEAIGREFRELERIFETEDALTGLLTFGRKRGKFVGR